MRRVFSTDQHFYLAVHSEDLAPSTRSLVDDRVKELRVGLMRLANELHRRIGTTRSRRALIARFKQRAEWHDARRLRDVANDPNGDLPGGPEDRLTEELARFLFDQGLNPLTKPLVGGLQPDLLDPSIRPGFYVEAKQYNSSARQAIIKSLAQVLDTVGRLQSEAYGITEAFCVVFRRNGPRYLLPEFVQAEGLPRLFHPRGYRASRDLRPPSALAPQPDHRGTLVGGGPSDGPRHPGVGVPLIGRDPAPRQATGSWAPETPTWASPSQGRVGCRREISSLDRGERAGVDELPANASCDGRQPVGDRGGRHAVDSRRRRGRGRARSPPHRDAGFARQSMSQNCLSGTWVSVDRRAGLGDRDDRQVGFSGRDPVATGNRRTRPEARRPSWSPLVAPYWWAALWSMIT